MPKINLTPLLYLAVVGLLATLAAVAWFLYWVVIGLSRLNW
jgi:uncharacterized membrane protein